MSAREFRCPHCEPWPLPEPHGARGCGCLACAQLRRERGLHPLPIRIGGLVIPSLPVEGRR